MLSKSKLILQVNKSNQNDEWFQSLIECLNWNDRTDQKDLNRVREIDISESARRKLKQYMPTESP